jgi:hypothetical protein
MTARNAEQKAMKQPSKVIASAPSVMRQVV